MHELVRASALTNFADLVEKLGGSPEALLRAVDLQDVPLYDPDAFIPLRGLSDVLELAAQELERPDFGLLLSSMQSMDILGPLALVARHSPSASAAIHDLARFIPAYAPAVTFDLEDLGGGISRYRFSIQVPMTRSTQILELGVGVSFANFKFLVGSNSRPVEVALPHPPAADRATYRAFFGCRVRWNAEYCGFDLRTADLERGRPNTDRELRRIITRYLEDTASTAEEGLAPQVRLLITKMLPTGHSTQANVSAYLGYHTRTVQRRLAAEGTSFEALLDDVRRERARHYLVNTTLPLGEIAAMLGYSQQSCLTRSTKRWFGASPREFRRAADPAN
jgi:AraC-like DNA-binding protein